MKKFICGFIIGMMIIFTGCSLAVSSDKRGQADFKNGKYEEAARDFAAAIKANPNRADYYINYGMALIALGKYEDAVNQFDLAYQDKDITLVKENNKRALRGKGIAYYYLKQNKKAIEEFDKALTMHELAYLDQDILYYKGSCLVTLGSYGLAEEVYNTILNKNEDNAEAYYNRAFVYRKLGEYGKSLSDYDKAISLQPDKYPYYFGKYYLLTENGKIDEASEVLAEAATIQVKTEEDSYQSAKIHYYQGDYKTALTELKKAYEKGFSEANYYIGELYKAQKDYSFAIYYYEAFIKDNKDVTSMVYNQLAACLMKQGNYEKALTYLDKGIAFKQTDTLRVLKKNEIIAYENLSKFDVALDKINAYLEEYPKDEQAIREREFLITRQEME